MKYLVVTGGVVSGLGKGISISSMGVLLKAHGLRCTRCGGGGGAALAAAQLLAVCAFASSSSSFVCAAAAHFAPASLASICSIKIDPYINCDAGTMRCVRPPPPRGLQRARRPPLRPVCPTPAPLAVPLRARAAALLSTARCLCSTTAARWTWTWATTSGSSTLR